MNGLTTTDTAEWSNESGASFLTPIGTSQPPSATGAAVERDANWEAPVAYDMLAGETSIYPIFRHDGPQSATVYATAPFALPGCSVPGWWGRQEALAATTFSLPERSVSTVLDAYGPLLPSRIVNRLRKLDEMPYGVEFDEDPMNPDSVEWFLKCFLSVRRMGRLPELSASSSGTLYAAWRPEPGTSVSVRFFPDGTIWAALLSNESEPKTWEISAEDVLKRHSLLPDPGII